MSKKMKRVVSDSLPFGVFEDSKVRLKHQILLQDYQDLHKETDDTRHKLEDANLRKLRLLAEVRFLRQRHRYLVQLKSLSRPQAKEAVVLPNSETYPKNKSRSEDRVPRKKEAKLNRLPPLPGPKQKGRIQVAKKTASQKTSDIHVNHKQKLHGGEGTVLHSSSLALNCKSRVYSGKEVPFQKAAPSFDFKQNERLFFADNAVLRSTTPAFDLNQDSGHSRKKDTLPSRAPVFDLNEISMGEEEPHAYFEQFKEPKRSLIRNMNEDQHNDLKLLICRNVGEGPSRSGKRKISWQDPVALRV